MAGENPPDCVLGCSSADQDTECTRVQQYKRNLVQENKTTRVQHYQDTTEKEKSTIVQYYTRVKSTTVQGNTSTRVQGLKAILVQQFKSTREKS